MQAAKPSRTFQLIAGSPALDFVNALDWRFRESGPEELLNSYGDLLRFAEQSRLLNAKLAKRLAATVSGAAGSRVLATAKRLRETLASVFYDDLEGRTPAPKMIGAVQQSIQDARRRQILMWTPQQFFWDWPGEESEAELPLWVISLSAEQLLLSGDLAKVRACGNLECRWLFLDNSKSHNRRWCDMKLCGNRMKARRFKANRL